MPRVQLVVALEACQQLSRGPSNAGRCSRGERRLDALVRDKIVTILNGHIDNYNKLRMT